MKLKFFFKITILFSLLMVNECVYAAAAKWPEIKEVTKSFHMELDKQQIVSLVIYGKNNQPLYYLESHFVSKITDDVDDSIFSYSGTLDSRLVVYKERKKISTNLFQNEKNAVRDWQSDGRFVHSDMIGLVRARPSRSLVQRCKVRGMYIVMEVNNVVADKKGFIQSYNFKISFYNDPTATSDISDNANVDGPIK